MDGTLRDQLKQKMHALKSTYGVEITDQAQVIVGESLQAIISDPHRSWPSNVNNAKFQEDMLNALPSTLAKFATRNRQAKVTSFDLLHWISQMINQMCPFDKPTS